MTSASGTPKPTGVRLGRVFGVPVLLHPSWFVITVVLAGLYATQYANLTDLSGGGALLLGLAATAALLLSIFLHEVAHAVVARAVGTPPTHITLDLWGGHTGFVAEPATPGRSALVSLVGPATNAALALAGSLIRGPAERSSDVLGLLVGAFVLTNAFVAVFNALPGLPLDGGRALEALVWRLTGSRSSGTLAAGWCGRVVALAVVYWSVLRPLLQGGGVSLSGSIWLLAVAWMLWQGASGAITYAGWQRRTGSLQAGELMRPAVAVGPGTSVATALSSAGSGQAVVLLDEAGGPIAVLDETAASAVPTERRGELSATAVAVTVPPGARLPQAAAGADLLARLQAEPQPRYVVLGADGAVTGVLTWQAVAARIGRA
jgi:Zn-dependent protease